MKNRRICRLLAMMLVLMLATPCLAMAEEEIVAEPTAQAALPEEIGEGMPELAEEPDGAQEEIVVEQAETPAACEAELDLEAIEEAPAEVCEEPAAAAQATDDAEEAVAVAQAAEDAEETLTAAQVDDAEEVLAEAVPTPAETASEAPAEVLAEMPMAEAPVAEMPVAEAPMTESLPVAEAPAGEAVVADGAVAEQSDKAAAGGPTAVAINASQGNVFYLGMGPSQLGVILDPADAQTTLKWKSSKKKVVKVDKNGVLTPRKAGKAKITVTTGNKKKSSIKVTVRKNKVDGINARPSRALIRRIGRDWTFYPKSVERTAGGKYVCKFYLLNGLGRSKRINNLGLQLYVGGTLVAQKYIKRLKVSCGKGSSKVFKVTFGGADIVNPTPMLLPQYGAGNISVRLTTRPSLMYVVRK